MKTSKRKQWTPDHVRQLRADARKHVPARQIAKKLRRTEGATRQKAFAIGLSLESRIFRRKSPDPKAKDGLIYQKIGDVDLLIWVDENGRTRISRSDAPDNNPLWDIIVMEGFPVRLTAQGAVEIVRIANFCLSMEKIDDAR